MDEETAACAAVSTRQQSRLLSLPVDVDSKDSVSVVWLRDVRNLWTVRVFAHGGCNPILQMPTMYMSVGPTFLSHGDFEACAKHMQNKLKRADGTSWTVENMEPWADPTNSCARRGHFGYGRDMDFAFQAGWKGYVGRVGFAVTVILVTGTAVALWPLTAGFVMKKKFDKGEW